MDTQQLVPKSLETYQSCVKIPNFEFPNGWTTAPTPLISISSIKMQWALFNLSQNLMGVQKHLKRQPQTKGNLL